MDVMKMQLDLQSGLEKEIEKSSKKMKGFNSLIEKSEAGFLKVAKAVGGSLLKALHKMQNLLANIIPGFAGLFSVSTIFEATREVLRMDKSMTQLAYRMGLGADGVSTLKDSVYELNKELGISIEDSQDLVSTLTQMRTPLNMIKELTVTTGLFSELTGVAATEAAELAGSLAVAGKLGTESINETMNTMVQMQRAVGFTVNEMYMLSDSIKTTTQMLNTMGKNSKEIQSFNLGVIKLSGAFASVGVEARKATELIEELLDPGRVQDNAFLLSQLGISMEEAFAGDLDPGKLAEGFRNIGQNLQNMSGPAAAAMAREMNMSVRDLRQLGNLGEKELSKVSAAMADGASGAEAMQEAFKEEETSLQKFERGIERIKGVIGNLAEKIVPGIERGFEFLTEGGLSKEIDKIKKFFLGLGKNAKIIGIALIAGIALFSLTARKKFAEMGNDLTVNIKRGMIEGLKQGSEKGSLVKRKDVGGGDLRMRTEMGSGFKEMNKEADYLEIVAGSLDGVFSKVVNKSAGIKRELSNSATPVSILEAKLASMEGLTSSRLEKLKNEGEILNSTFEARNRDLRNEEKGLDLRIERIVQNQKEGKLSASQMATEAESLKKLETLRMQIQAKITENSKNEIAMIELNSYKQENAIKSMSSNQLLAIALNQKAEKERAQVSLENVKKEISAEQTKIERLKQARQEAKNLNIPAHERIEIEERLNSKIKEREGILRQNTNKQIELKSIIEGQTKEEEIALKVLKERSMAIEQGSIRRKEELGIIGRIRETVNQTGRNIGKNLKDGAASFSVGLEVAARNFAKRFKKENITAYFRKSFKGLLTKEGREERRAEKTAKGPKSSPFRMLRGPMMLLVGSLLRLEPVQEALKTVMDSVKTPLINLSQKIMPIFQKLMQSLQPAFIAIGDLLGTLVEALMPHLLTALSMLFKAIGWLITGLGKIFPSLKPIGESMLEAGNMMANAAKDLAKEQRRATRATERLAKIEEVRGSNDKILAGLQEQLGGVTAEQILAGDLNSEQLNIAQQYIKDNSKALRLNYEALMRDEIQGQADALKEGLISERGWLGRFFKGRENVNIEEMKKDEAFMAEFKKLQDFGVNVELEDLFKKVYHIDTSSVMGEGRTEFQKLSEKEMNKLLAPLIDKVVKDKGAEFAQRLEDDPIKAFSELNKATEERRKELEKILKGINGNLEDMPGEIAEENAKKTITRKISPAEYRALIDGTLKNVKDNISIEETVEGEDVNTQIVQNSTKQVEQQQQQIETLERQLKLQEQELIDAKERSNELIAAIADLRKAVVSGGYSNPAFRAGVIQ